MKKFERLPAADRKDEIKKAAILLFLEKGFRATTMENIISAVSLSKGGVYRLYPSTTAILSDIILDGAAARNAYYQELAQQKIAEGKQIDASTVAEIICEGMLCYPEIAEVYAEFLIEKRRIPELEELYRTICRETTELTTEMIRQMGLEEELEINALKLSRLTDIMNTATLGIIVLNQKENFEAMKQQFITVLISALM